MSRPLADKGASTRQPGDIPGAPGARTSSEGGGNGDGMPSGRVAGAVVGGVAALAVVGLVAAGLLLMRKRMVSG
jgi:hypothetical protein